MKRGQAPSLRAALLASAICGALGVLLIGARAPASEPGQLIVTDAGQSGSLGANGSVIAIDPDTGAQTRLTTGGSLYNPRGVVVDASGDILVADPVYGVGGSVSARVVRIDGATGIQTRTIRDRLIEEATDIALASDGEIFVLQRLARQSIVRIDPVTERLTPLFGEPAVSLGNPLSAVFGPGGALFVSDTFDHRILRIDPAQPRAFTELVPDDGLLEPTGIALGPSGLLYVASPGLRAVYSVDPKTGITRPVSSFGLFEWPLDVAVAADGMLYVVDVVANAIFSVHPSTGAQTLVSADQFLIQPVGIAIVPGGSADSDGDTVLDAFDDCPRAADLGQVDTDDDGLGDACDPFPDDPDDLSRCVDLRDDNAVRLAELESEHAGLSAIALERIAEQTALLADRERLLAVDSDGDGIPDVRDTCPGTPLAARRVDERGCDLPQRIQLRLARGTRETKR